MSWRIRHAGSPKHVGDLTLNQIVQGLQDGEWATDDEVQGPGDRGWTTIADHPQFEDLAEALDIAAENEGKVMHDPEEDRIDMNPLIDVCLVLLVFFILATTMAVMEKVLQMPQAKQAQEGVPNLTDQQVKEKLLVVEARMTNGRPVVKLEKQEVSMDGLMVRLRNLREQTQKTQVAIDAKDVDWQTVVNIIGAAQGAGINKVSFKVDKPGGPAASRPAR